MGKRLNIIIVAEGAMDRHGNAITVNQIKDVSTIFFVHFIVLQVVELYIYAFLFAKENFLFPYDFKNMNWENY